MDLKLGRTLVSVTCAVSLFVINPPKDFILELFHHDKSQEPFQKRGKNLPETVWFTPISGLLKNTEGFVYLSGTQWLIK